jgi:hypothetical protein
MKSAVVALASVLLAAPAAQAEPSRYGAMADMGLPDGFMAAFMFRAHDWVTAHAALGHNTNSPGFRIGASFSPIDYAVEPYTALELGYYFEAETASWMRDTAKKAGLDDKTLDRVGYKFVNGHLGLRFGNASASAFIQGGISFIDAKALVIKPKPNFAPPVDLYRETVVHVWTVSGRVGIAYYF